MSPPSLDVSDRSKLRDFLSRWASRYHPEQVYQQRLVERTIVLVTSDTSAFDEGDASRRIIAVLHRLAVAELNSAVVQGVFTRTPPEEGAEGSNDTRFLRRLKALPLSQSSLAGRRCLVVEDEYHAAFSLLDVLERAGATVLGPVSNVTRALEVLAEPSFALDVAILDINLNGQMVYPAAALLAERGTPFVFVTGYDGMTVPDEFAQAPCLAKPCDKSTLLKTLSSIVVQAGV